MLFKSHQHRLHHAYVDRTVDAGATERARVARTDAVTVLTSQDIGLEMMNGDALTVKSFIEV